MNRFLPLNMLAIFFFICACNQTKPTILKDSPVDYKKYWNEYNYAYTLLGSKNDSAFVHFSHIANNSKDSLLIAISYTEMGIMQNDAGDYYGSQESLLLSLDRLNENKKQHEVYLACTYNELGVNSNSLKNFDQAIQYFRNAIHFSNNDSIRMISINNLANAYRNKKDYIQAIAIYDTALQTPKNTPRQYARILSNLSYTNWLRNPDYNAAPDLQLSMQIRKHENDEHGLLASYQQLTDYYLNTHTDSALFYAYQFYLLTRHRKSPDDELSALSKLIPLSNLQASKKYFARHQFLSDSIQTGRNNAKNQFALIRYETEKHKTDKLELQKENAEAQLRVIWLQVSSVILLIGAISGFIWYRNRKERTMRNRELRTSQKVHDVVANGIYSIMAKLEYEPEIIKDDLLDEMEILYEQSRDLSHEGPGVIIKGFDKDIARLITSFSSQLTRVAIVGNTPALWKSVKPAVQNEILLVVKEFLINMKKYSAAQNVVIKFNHSNEGLQIQYTDDGIGLPNVITYGRGLKSTENRIITIGGRITFDNSIPKGLKIDIIIPTIHL